MSFTSDKPLDATGIAQVEEEVNEVLRDIEVDYLETTLDEALRMGALAMFEEFGNRVRVA